MPLQLSPERQSLFWTLIRSTPLSLLVILGTISGYYPQPITLIFIISYLITFGSNVVFKYIAQCIYKWYDTDYLPLFGKGSRPSGAFGCSSLLYEPHHLLPATSFGMPSGHSQLAWFFVTFICLTYLNPFAHTKSLALKNKTHAHTYAHNTKRIIYIIILILFAVCVSYSRVYIENCHTVEQVIVGGIIGGIMALFTIHIMNAHATFTPSLTL